MIWILRWRISRLQRLIDANISALDAQIQRLGVLKRKLRAVLDGMGRE